jgi:hypothetical protein
MLPSATGMGSVCPFAYGLPDRTELPLIFETVAPLLSSDECRVAIDEARAHIAAGGEGTGFTYTDTAQNVAVASLPRTLAWLNGEGSARIAALTSSCYGEAVVGAPSELQLYRALVVHYDAAQGLTHQQVSGQHPIRSSSRSHSTPSIRIDPTQSDRCIATIPS